MGYVMDGIETLESIRRAKDAVMKASDDISPDSIINTPHTQPKATCEHPMCRLKRSLIALDETLPRQV